MKHLRCEKCEQYVALVALSSSAFLALLKLVVGVTGHSKGCIADALHSATIFVMALAIILGQRFGKKPETPEFHYGYGKIEPVITGSITFLLACGTGWLIWGSLKHLFNVPHYEPPHLSTLLMAVTSIAANYVLMAYLRCVGTQFKNQATLSTMQAHRESLVSSCIVVAGILGAELGFGILDPIAAILVVALILRACVKILVDSVKPLLDFSVNESCEDKIRSVLENVDGVLQISALRTRQIGHRIWLDLDIGVNPQQSIGEANIIADKVRNLLLKQISDLERVMVHCRPLENDPC